MVLSVNISFNDLIDSSIIRMKELDYSSLFSYILKPFEMDGCTALFSIC